jgi:hypothetical protein
MANSTLSGGPVMLLVSKLMSFLDDKNNSAGLLIQALHVLSALANHPRTANEGLVRIQYKCLVPIYVFPEMTKTEL